MTTSHQKHLEAIRMASPERPYTVDYDFLDMVQQSYPDIYKMIQQDMKNKVCIAIPAGFHLAEA